jgi:hypothetical protein
MPQSRPKIYETNTIQQNYFQLPMMSGNSSENHEMRIWNMQNISVINQDSIN